MKTIRLQAFRGSLYFPTGGWKGPTTPSMLMRVYPAGDADTCAWPMIDDGSYSVEKQRKILAAALYDEREMNSTFPVDATIELPDGQEFDFDALVD